ncbi:ABC transporter ATP-binding protein [Calderihabitans maritimus]|uniref:ABC transporter-like protein n=1 Tax=Calderihabitans maritimus TaxID=1246530 RepID=A0A1Z5HN81_9FIRM|nr:ABC transporter ATP-binding protein [Calderihabitans maritimus]GAW90979.1 ABC transporter-like protein [Calderihabitans maritimus]
MIELREVSKFYGDKVGVENLSFQVKPGELVGLLGPNGAGKTTTLRLITGYLQPSRGEVLVNGLEVSQKPLEVKRLLGYLPDTPPLYREMTVRSYLSFVAEIKEVPRRQIRKRVDTLLEELNLTEVQGRLIGNLSRGYRQRVGLAQALVSDPEILVLDEPTTGLDPKQIMEVRNLIKELAGRRTVILSSHILPEVSMICERVIIIDRGRVIAQDTPAGLAASLRGSPRIELEVKGPAGTVKNLLAQVPGVQEIELKQEAAGRCVFSVNSSSQEDIREEIFFAMAGAGYPILQMRNEDLSLEEVFLQLVTRE